MIEFFRQSIVGLFQIIPSYVYEWLIVLLFIGLICLLLLGNPKIKIKLLSMLILFEYLTILLSITVCFREPLFANNHFFTPFWGLEGVRNGDKAIIAEKIMNIIAFIPVGLLFSIVLDHIKWWHIMLLGLGLSLSIETLQFAFQRGTADIDDIILNTTGCLIGYGINAGVQWVRGLIELRFPVNA